MFNSFYEILARRAESQADVVAYSFGANESDQFSSITYGELNKRVQVLLGQLHGKISKGDRAIITMPSCVEFTVAFYACQALGVISVPAPTPSRKRSDERLSQIASDSGASMVLTISSVAETLRDNNNHGALQGLPLICVDGAESGVPFDSSMLADIQHDDVAFLQYTSGSTGSPKGVVVTYENLLHNSELIARNFDHSVDNVAVTWLPFFHDMGLIGGLLSPMYVGFPMTIVPPAAFLMRPLMWLKLMDSLQATISVCPNFALELCAEKATPEFIASLNLSSMKIIICGAEPIQAGTVERFIDLFSEAGFNPAALSPSYGLAEATLLASGSPYNVPYSVAYYPREQVAEVGRELLAASDSAQEGTVPVMCCGAMAIPTAIVHPETKQRLQDGCVGEIWLSGSSIAKGYWKKPQLSEEIFGNRIAGDSEERCYLRSGDLGFVSEGMLYVTGRIKDVLIIRGKNIYPQDVERLGSTVSESLSTGLAAAFTVAEDEKTRLVVVFESSRRGKKELADTVLANRLVNAINSAIVEETGVSPDAVCIVKPGQILRTSSGKIRRAANRKAWEEGSLDALHSWQLSEDWTEESNDAYSASRGAAQPLQSKADIEGWIVSRIAERCAMDPRDVGLNQPFVIFGLDSLQAVKLIEALNARMGSDVRIDPTALWSYPTIESLVQYLCEMSEGVIEIEKTPRVSTKKSGPDTKTDDEVEKLKLLLDI